MFYGGMVQPKNYLHTVMQSFTICCLVTCIWMIFGCASVQVDVASVQADVASVQADVHKPLLTLLGNS